MHLLRRAARVAWQGGEVAPVSIVDIHTHVVPSGDDGAESVEEGLRLCRMALEAGTRVLFATPHVHAPWDSFPWTPDREARYTEAFAEMRPIVDGWGLDLRRGREVFPTELAKADMGELALEGTSAVLLEFPGWWLELEDSVGITWEACERAEAVGLVPVLAHPERCPAIVSDPGRARAFAERGWPLCLNGASLLGDHGRSAYGAGWELLELEIVSLVASDAHGLRRPPVLDASHAAVADRLGRDVADPLFNGSALPWSAEGDLQEQITPRENP